MRRTKEWWARLDEYERRELVFLEKANNGYDGGCHAYLPEGYSECNCCSTPCSSNLCRGCGNRLYELIDKANGETQ